MGRQASKSKEDGVKWNRVTASLPEELHKKMRIYIASQDHPYTQLDFINEAVKSFFEQGDVI